MRDPIKVPRHVPVPLSQSQPQRQRQQPSSSPGLLSATGMFFDRLLSGITATVVDTHTFQDLGKGFENAGQKVRDVVGNTHLSRRQPGQRPAQPPPVPPSVNMVNDWLQEERTEPNDGRVVEIKHWYMKPTAGLAPRTWNVNFCLSLKATPHGCGFCDRTYRLPLPVGATLTERINSMFVGGYLRLSNLPAMQLKDEDH